MLHMNRYVFHNALCDYCVARYHIASHDCVARSLLSCSRSSLITCDRTSSQLIIVDMLSSNILSLVKCPRVINSSLWTALFLHGATQEQH